MIELEEEKYQDDLQNMIEILVNKSIYQYTLKNKNIEYDIPDGIVKLLLENDIKKFRSPNYKPSFFDVSCIPQLRSFESPLRVNHKIYTIKCEKSIKNV